jgi:hypothetical protein
MRLELLRVPGCPNVTLLHQRLEQALAGHPTPVEVAHRVVEDLQAAAAVGMTGSPTLLVDGVDPFAEPGLSPSVSCRLYRGADDRAQRAPSVAQLRQALGIAGHGEGDEEAGNPPGTENCCAGDATRSAAGALRIWRERAAPADAAERVMHQVILRAFAITGSPPAPSELTRAAAASGAGAQDVLERLHAADVVHLGPDGDLQAAYPFSASPTRHRVRLADGVEVSAMCVIDALGIPSMLGTDAVITTADPVSGTPITVTATGGQFTWDPNTAVVFVGARPGHGPSAQTCCDYLNAFTDRPQAGTWVHAHPQVHREILTPAEAELLGRRIFGGLLTSA